MSRLIRSDGNGGIVLQRGIAIALGLIAFAGWIWAGAMTWSHQTAVTNFEQKIEMLEERQDKIEKRQDESERITADYRRVESERIARIEVGIQNILEKLEENKGRR